MNIENLKAEYSAFSSEENSHENRIDSALVIAGYFPQIVKALEESLKLQSHYASLLNMYDGGKRIEFKSVDEFMNRLKESTGLETQHEH